MYELLQRVCTTITSFSSYLWPRNSLGNTTKRLRDQIDITDDNEDDDDDIVVSSTKKLKIYNSCLIENELCVMKSAKTQTEGMTMKRHEKKPWRFKLSTKENWESPIEVVDLVEETPNKFKNQYRPPQHVRSPHRIRRKFFNSKQKGDISNGVTNSSRDNNLSYKSVNTNQSSRNSWSSNKIGYKMALRKSLTGLDQNEAQANFQRTSCLPNMLDHDAYSKMLNSFIRKEPQPVQTATNTGVTVDLTADSEEELPSSSSIIDRRIAKCLDDCSKLVIEDNGSSSAREGPNKRRVKPTLAGIEVNCYRSRQIISLDDDDEEVDDDIQIIQTPPVPKVNSLEYKIQAQTKVANEQWTADLIRKYEDKKSEMEEMTKMLSMELKIASEKHRSSLHDFGVKYLSKHLEITESLLDEDELEPSLPQLTPEMQDVVNKASKKQPANEILISKYNYNIKRIDLNALTGLNWLNDEVINFYTTLIMERSKENAKLPKTYSFSTFFYLRLLNSGYTGVKRWTRKIDIFAHDIILIPVHLKMHWCLAAIDFVNRTINYYDSMGTTNDQCLNKLEEYIIEEYKDKKGQVFNMDGWSKNNVKDIPRQMNGSDCGVFCCTFAEFLARRASFTFEQKDMSYIRQKMIYEIVSGKLLT